MKVVKVEKVIGRDLKLVWKDGNSAPMLEVANKPHRSIVLHGFDHTKDSDIPNVQVAIFERLLTFDQDTISTRTRNYLLTKIRQFLPFRFCGGFKTDKGSFTFTVKGETIHVFNKENKPVLRLAFFKFSRVIKGTLA